MRAQEEEEILVVSLAPQKRICEVLDTQVFMDGGPRGSLGRFLSLHVSRGGLAA